MYKRVGMNSEWYEYVNDDLTPDIIVRRRVSDFDEKRSRLFSEPAPRRENSLFLELFKGRSSGKVVGDRYGIGHSKAKFQTSEGVYFRDPYPLVDRVDQELSLLFHNT